VADLQLVLEILGLGIAFVFFGFDKLDLFKGKTKTVVGIVYLCVGLFFIVVGSIINWGM